MSAHVYPEKKFTYADYCSWPEAVKGELIDGEFFMTPAPTLMHQNIGQEILAYVRDFIRKTKSRKLYFGSPVDLLLPRHPDIPDSMVTDVVQPDVVVGTEALIFAYGKGLRGSPEWIVEVLSPTTRERDQNDKRELYERNKVKLYWLVDPDTYSLTALVLDKKTGKYKEAAPVVMRGKVPVPQYKGLVIDWDDVFRWTKQQHAKAKKAAASKPKVKRTKQLPASKSANGKVPKHLN